MGSRNSSGEFRYVEDGQEQIGFGSDERLPVVENGFTATNAQFVNDIM